MKQIQLFQGDCLELMKDIPDGSVDMIMCDLPYGTTACKWDSIIPFEPLWEQYKRIIKSNGAIVLTASQPFTTSLIAFNVEMFKYCWVWEKSRPSGFAHAKNMPLKNYEDVCVFSTGVIGHVKQCINRMQYNPQGLFHSQKIMKNTKVRGENESAFGNRPSHKDSYLQEWTNYPSQVLRFGSESHTIHPTQKPVALMEYLIRTYTNENEVVLDNCMGSGTTGVACLNTNRKFIGMEQDHTYFELASKRINDKIDEISKKVF